MVALLYGTHASKNEENPNEQKCPYCQGKKDNEALIDKSFPEVDKWENPSLDAVIGLDNQLYVGYDAHSAFPVSASVKIKYCPMCGRRL